MGRAAILELCESYRNDMRTVKQATHFKALHFHGIQNDEGALYDPDRVTKDPGLAVPKLQVASEYDLPMSMKSSSRRMAIRPSLQRRTPGSEFDKPFKKDRDNGRR